MIRSLPLAFLTRSSFCLHIDRRDRTAIFLFQAGPAYTEHLQLKRDDQESETERSSPLGANCAALSHHFGGRANADALSDTFARARYSAKSECSSIDAGRSSAPGESTSIRLSGGDAERAHRRRRSATSTSGLLAKSQRAA